jgi:phage repressor protein C with HTH and peptisase S24 domain
MSEFIEHIVNQKFKLVYETLEHQNRIKGKSDLAKNLATYNHVVNSILKGQRNITLDQLNKLFETYGVNANYLFGLSSEMFLANKEELPTRSLQEKEYLGSRDNILLVPSKALAGYATELQDKTYMESLQRFSIPGLEGNLLAFEISGDSMQPTITNGDLVICAPLERGEPLRDNQVYIIVTDVVVAKRIQQIKDNQIVQSLRLISDNSAVFKPYDVELEDVRQILQVKCRLTSHAIN